MLRCNFLFGANSDKGGMACLARRRQRQSLYLDLAMHFCIGGFLSSPLSLPLSLHLSLSLSPLSPLCSISLDENAAASSLSTANGVVGREEARKGSAQLRSAKQFAGVAVSLSRSLSLILQRQTTPTDLISPKDLLSCSVRERGSLGAIREAAGTRETWHLG